MTKKKKEKSIEINSPIESLKNSLSDDRRGQTKIITAVVLTIFSLVGLGLYFDFGIGILNTLEQPPQAQISVTESSDTMTLTVRNLGENVDKLKIRGDVTNDGITGDFNTTYTDVSVGDTTDITLGGGTGELSDDGRVTVVALDEPDNENVVLQRTYNSVT